MQWHHDIDHQHGWQTSEKLLLVATVALLPSLSGYEMQIWPPQGASVVNTHTRPSPVRVKRQAYPEFHKH
jgi:hypothetical protein